MNKYITAGGIDKLHEFYRKGNDEYAKYGFYRSLSREETAYLDDFAKNGSKVRIALEHDNYPISFYAEQNREFQGIAPDILAEVSRLSGIEFEVVTDRNATWSEILDRLRTGDVALVSELEYSDEREDDFIWADVPYLTFRHALLSRADYPDLEMYQIIRATVGFVKDTIYEGVFKAWFPDHSSIKHYNTHYEAFDALEKGEIDLFMAAEYMLLFQMNYREKPDYKANIVFNTPVKESFF
jgi:ABC-type amino acid transport substrate-binding protein